MRSSVATARPALLHRRRRLASRELAEVCARRCQPTISARAASRVVTLRCRAGVPHRADPPHLAGDRAQAAPDLDAVVGEQPGADLCFGQRAESPVGDRDRAEGRQPVTFCGEQLEAELLHACLDCVAGRLVPVAGRLEAFVEHGAEAGVERHDHRDRSSVVIGACARAGDVGGDHVEVEVPRRWFRENPIDSPIRHRERRQPRRAGEALLRAAVDHVGAPGVDGDRDCRPAR